MVLILVVMECFRKSLALRLERTTMCFNPCCNGMFSKGGVSLLELYLNGSFNPCCNGMFSKESCSQLFPILF